jgi:xanthine dehydrogenase accessory factor
MNENEYLAKTIRNHLEDNSPVVLISLMSLEGSTPRHSGTKMVLGGDGRPYGTIGGSLVEAAAIDEAKNILANKKSRILSYEMTGDDAASPGMICGGRAEILLEYLPASGENREFARQWYDAIQHGKDFYILTHFHGSSGDVKILGHAVLLADGTVSGNTSLSTGDISTLKPELHNISHSAPLPLDETTVMVDRIRKLKTLYCFGGGHVAVPTAHLAAMVGFRVVVIDDRPEFANAQRFPEAASTIVINDFDRAFEGLDIDEDSFIVIITRGHQYDQSCLEQALKTSAGYIGMISSRRKRDVTYKALMDQGITRERLDQVHSPIGINIGGETPEEIGVSIVAELIAKRSRSTG